jgi:hypothetical protein
MNILWYSTEMTALRRGYVGVRPLILPTTDYREEKYRSTRVHKHMEVRVHKVRLHIRASFRISSLWCICQHVRVSHGSLVPYTCQTAAHTLPSSPAGIANQSRYSKKGRNDHATLAQLMRVGGTLPHNICSKWWDKAEYMLSGLMMSCRSSNASLLQQSPKPFQNESCATTYFDGQPP